MIPTSKSSGEHEYGRFWGMKVGNKSVDGLEFETRVDKDIIFAEGLASLSPEFESTCDGGADGDYAVAGSLGDLDGFDGIFWNLEPFGMHFMLFDVVGADWQEGAETDMKGEIFDLNAFGLKFSN